METITQEIKVYDYNDVKNDVDGIRDKVLDNLRYINTEMDIISDSFAQWIQEIFCEIGSADTSPIYYCLRDRGEYVSFNATIYADDIILKNGLFDMCAQFPTWKGLHDICGNLIYSILKTPHLSLILNNICELDIWASTSDIMKYTATWGIDGECKENVFEAVREHIAEAMEEFLCDIKAMLVNAGNEEIDYLQSDNAILETIECNDYKFTENGEIY